MNYAFPPPHALNIFESMKSNYKLCVKNYKKNFKSLHWDVFPENYENIFNDPNIWKTFLRNHISIGFNDALIEVSNKRFKDGNDLYWGELKKNDDNLLNKNLTSHQKINEVIGVVNYLLSNIDPHFLINNLMPECGDPAIVSLEIENPDKTKLLLPVNSHDVVEIYYFYKFQRVLNELKKEKNPVIAEIGAGYGGMATKIKKNLNQAKYIIFDLPEVNAVQTYYLKNVFSDKKVLGYEEFLQSNDIMSEDFDFLILPGWEITNFKKDCVNTFINMRSMMEMNFDIIEFYMKSIHTMSKVNSFFFNVNRYKKRDIKFSSYPYDKKWKVIDSTNSNLQNHIHILTTQRTKENQNFNIKKHFEG